MSRSKANRVREIADTIGGLIEEARKIARTTDGIFYDSYDAYVFRQIEEHLNKGNPYNKDLNDLANDLEDMVCEDDE